MAHQDDHFAKKKIYINIGWKIKINHLNSDGKHFHQYQENDQLPLILTHWTQKRKFKQWWPSISPISTKQTITSHLNIKNTMTYDAGYPSPGLRQAQTMICSGALIKILVDDWLGTM